MLARYSLTSSVRLSVCLSQAGIVSKRLDESSWLFVMEASFHPSDIVLTGNLGRSYLQKYGYSFWNFDPNCGLGKFLSGTSIALSTTRRRWRHLYDSRLYPPGANTSISSLDLLYNLFVELCSSWRDFDWHSASRGPSAPAELLVAQALIMTFAAEYISDSQVDNHVNRIEWTTSTVNMKHTEI